MQRRVCLGIGGLWVLFIQGATIESTGSGFPDATAADPEDPIQPGYGSRSRYAAHGVDQDTPPMQPNLPSCNCGCCEVEKLLPSQFVHVAAGTLTSTCGKPRLQDQQAQTCPDHCSSRDAILSNSLGPMDYARYCSFNCIPFADVQGAECVPMQTREYRRHADAGDGNGAEVHLEPVLGIGSGYGRKKPPGMLLATSPPPSEAAAVSSSSSAAATSEDSVADSVAKKAKKKSPEDVDLVYDMRKMIAERLRAEAGASVSASADAAERVRFNAMEAKQATKEVAGVKVIANKVAAKVAGAVSGIVASREMSDEASSGADRFLKESRAMAPDILKDAVKLADAAIEKAVEPCATRIAQVKAEAKHLDKPEKWEKVVITRAAEPYQKALVVSVQRADEYRREAEKLHSEAVGLQKQANDLMPHVNLMEAHGDTMEALLEKKNVKNLLARARMTQDAAKRYWTTAANTQKTVPKWQNAVTQAGAYAAYLYENEAALKGLD